MYWFIVVVAYRAKNHMNQAILQGAAYQMGKGHGPVHHFFYFWKWKFRSSKLILRNFDQLKKNSKKGKGFVLRRILIIFIADKAENALFIYQNNE